MSLSRKLHGSYGVYQIKWAIFFFAIFLSFVFQILFVSPSAATLCSFEKVYPYGYESKLKPNVLIIIDTSTSMLDAPNGSDTYGDGSKPVSKRGNDNYEIYWGKDTNPDNNDPITGDYLPDLKYITVQDAINAFNPDLKGPGKDGQYYGVDFDKFDHFTQNEVKNFINNNIPNEFSVGESPTEWFENVVYCSQVKEKWKRYYGNWYVNLSDEDYDSLITSFGQPVPQDTEPDEDNDPDFISDKCTKYRYPNDSRIYQVKLVLWNLLNDPEVTGRLRIGLSTFYQEDYNSLPDSWTTYGYKWPATANNWNQYFSKGLAEVGTCGADTSRILLCEPVDDIYDLDSDGNPVSSTDHLDEIFSWINGIEIPGNPEENEIRAHGNTPIYYIFEQIPLVFDPLSDYNDLIETDDPVIQNWCQDNFIILLTDGVDQGDYPGHSGYYQHNSSELASRFGHFFEDSKKNFGAENETGNIRTLVIGFSTGSTDMKNKCNAMADAGWDGSNDDSGPNGENNEDQAYMASNITELTAQFKEIFHTISDFSSSSGSPLVTVEEADENNTEVYQASYYPKQDDMWVGHFKKYTVTTVEDDEGNSVSSTSLEWDAQSSLEQMSSADRTVYTVTADNLNLDNSTVNAMVPFSYSSILADNMDCTEDQARQLINDLLGDSGEKKLGDIYHSGFVKVGDSPREELACSRDVIIYVQANDGMLHAFNDEDTDDNPAGKERWAFIPPNVLSGGRLKGLKLDSEGNWKENENLSSKYLCDGPLVVEDVQFDVNDDNSWKTVLVGSLGYGGTGIYALDVTDPDSPQFLWALENDIFENENKVMLSSADMEVQKWTASHFKTVKHNDGGSNTIRRYRETMFPMSTPFIGRITSLASGTYASYANKWVAIMGNGSSMGADSVSLKDKGSVLFIDITNGDVLAWKNSPSGQIVSPIVVPVTTSEEQDLHEVKEFYFATDGGRVYKVNLEEDSRVRVGKQLPSPVNGISYSMDLARINNNIWLFLATGDIDPLVEDNAKVTNNYVCALNTASDPDDAELIMLLPEETGSTSASSDGWALELDADNDEFEIEYVTGMPYYYKGYLFFSTFKKGKDTCSLGDSRLYCVKASNGSGGWNEDGATVDKYVTIHNVRITGLTIQGDSMYIGATRYVEEDNLGDLPSGFQWVGNGFNLIIGPAAHTTETGTLDSNSVLKPLYWRHRNFQTP